jgi:type I restriction enzyme S subunit
VSGLPKGWLRKPLSQLTSIITKGTTPTTMGFQYTTEGVRFVKIESLKHLRIQHRDCAYISDEAHSALARSQLKAGDILFSIAGTLGRVALVAESDIPANTNQALAIIRPVERANSPYLARYLTANIVQSSATSGGRGTGLQNLNLKQISDIIIFLPPLPEQRRIVTKVDSLTGRTARSREELERIPKLIQKYREAILAAAFSGELTRDWRHTKGTKGDWETRKVNDIISAIVAGKNLRCLERPPLATENGVVKVSAVTWGNFDPMASKTLPTDCAPPERTRINGGDFLISRANTLELVGAVVIVDRAPANLFLSDKILRLEMKQEHKPWLLWFLRSPKGRAAIETTATGNQLSMRNLSQDALRKIEVPWPSTEEISEIVRRIETAFTWLDRITVEHANASRLLPKLDQAILTKAFRGELVPQDPNDMPLELSATPPAKARAAVVA